MAKQLSTKPDDIDIAILILDDREAGCRQLLEVHGPKIKAMLYKTFRDILDSDELESVLGEAAARVVATVEDGSFDSTRPFVPWFIRIASNIACNTFRSEKRHTRQLLEFDPPHDARSPACLEDDEDPKKTRIIAALAEEIEDLPSEQRRVVKAWLAAHATPQTDLSAAARAIGKTVGNFHATLNHAKRQLLHGLEKRGFSYL